MAVELPEGLVRWAAMAGPSLVLDAVRRRAERGAATERGTLRIELSPTQRREVARVLGTPWDVSGRAVRLQDLAAALAHHDLTVRSFVEGLDGQPLIDQRVVRAGRRTAAGEERAAARATLIDAGFDAAVAESWLDDPGLTRPGTGELRSLTERSVAVCALLPGRAGPPIRLARLAARAEGDAHVLDYRSELGRAVARLIARAHGLPRPLSAGTGWRAAWAAAGVQCDEVSSRVLALNLPLSGAAPAARWCAAAPGAPVWLTLRSMRGGWSVPAATAVFVCENPTVVEAAADELGARCPPLVGTDGIPSLAALDLIGGLAAAGCDIRVRADIDEAGFVVVDQVRSVAPGATLWRFDAGTYRRHLDLPGDPDLPTGDAVGQLRQRYARHGRPVHEEALLDDLLRDLAAGRCSDPR